MPEVPENMQQNLAHLEQHAQEPTSYNYPPRSQSANQGYPGQNQNQSNNYRPQVSPEAAYYSQQPELPQDYARNANTRLEQQAQSYRQSAGLGIPEPPTFSPFPPLRDVSPNVPPTDEQREATLEAAREAVLASNDPETQLAWAQDTLSYVEIALQNEQRLSATQPPRSHTPRVEHMLKEDAMKIVTFLAEQHHPKAEFLRGVWLEFGKFGYRIDKKEAFHCYTRALENGYARAYYRIGMQFEQSNEPIKATAYYQNGVDAGDSAACYRLGMMALLGQHGQPQDFQRGINLIYSSSQSADENAPQGAYVFGMLQARELAQVSIPERFLPLDVHSARINIEKAAYLGFAKAQVKMGAAYELCEMDCEFNPTLSLHYNALAARQGEADAEMAISKWFLCGYEGVFEKNEEMAFKYAQRAAQSGLPTAQFALGYFYEVGIYIPMNLKEAREWYSKAAANGNKDAGGRIESISRSKTISRNDHERLAVSKIRQQHGSQAVGPNAAPPMPTMPPAIDMPDASRLSLNPNGYGHAYAAQRPPAAAPYPVDGRDPNRPALASQTSTFSTQDRPTSAFGINPNLRPSSAAPGPGSRPDNYRPNGMPNHSRPYSSMEPGAQGYPTNSRLPSGQGAQGRPQPRPGIPHAATTGAYSGQNTGGTPPMKADIGFTAPVDMRQRPYRPSQPNPGSSQPMPPRLSSMPPASARPYQQSFNENQRPPSATNQRPASAANNRPTPNTAPNQHAAGPSKPPTPAPNRPPGKGPKTFDEMGVPQVKKDGDCVSTLEALIPDVRRLT